MIGKTVLVRLLRPAALLLIGLIASAVSAVSAADGAGPGIKPLPAADPRPSFTVPYLVSQLRSGQRLGQSLTLWHDPGGSKALSDALRALTRGQFVPVGKRHSTGLLPGTFWGYVTLVNDTASDATLHLEYVDHQLLFLNAFARSPGQRDFRLFVELAMDRAFAERAVAHHRFVVPVVLAAGESRELLLQYGSVDDGFVFPDLRVWEPEQLRQVQNREVALMGFIAGGLLLMGLVAFTVGVATGEKLFFMYALYALAKIAMWTTMVGLTHQFLIDEHFHWSYISLCGAVVIAAGICFARMFLQTRIHTPKLDYLLMLIVGLAGVLVVAALLQQKGLAVVLITLVLFLYPLVCVAGVIRWCQGSREAGVFALAWAFLVAGLLAQALRDLGYVPHNLVNYYWPTVGSFTEMVVILIAMGMNLRRLRHQKDAAEHRYLVQLENKKIELEALVLERTKELETAKSLAEIEASTDPLTGTSNRRSFFRQASKLLQRSQHRNAPFSVLMFDIDHFKDINDNYGHKVGDQALRLFARTIMLEIRDTDIFGRLGGEEFALVLAGSNDDALQTAERLREVVGQLRVISGEDEVSFTTSIGVCHYAGEKNIEDILYRADTALYDAKLAGRNRVKLATALI